MITPTLGSELPETGYRSGTTITALHPDVLTKVLSQLDGATLVAAACATVDLRSLSNQESLWLSLCHLTFPAISTHPPLCRLISNFPGGFRSFYADSFPLISGTVPPSPPVTPAAPPLHLRPSDLIFLVEIYYKQKLFFSKILYGTPESHCLNAWLCNSPFRIDLLDQNDKPPPIMTGEKSGDFGRRLVDDLRLRWVAIDGKQGRAVNLSSWNPVAVQRHWFSESEISVKFASILPENRFSSGSFVQFGIVVRCEGCGEEELRVREVSLQVGDVGGGNLNGRESLKILQSAMEGCERRKGCGDVQRRYDEFLKLQKEVKEKRVKTEVRKDITCTVSGILVFAAFYVCFVCM